jgi:hypothetical protein
MSPDAVDGGAVSKFAADPASLRNEFDNQFAGERSTFATQRGNWKSRATDANPDVGMDAGRYSCMALEKDETFVPTPGSAVSGAMQG